MPDDTIRRLIAPAASVALAGALLGAPSARALEAAPPGVDARAVAERVEDNLRGVRTSTGRATMTVVSPRLPEPREVGFRYWEDRASERSFIRILAPPKDAGMGFLKIPPNLWNYIPRVERTVRIPPSMMLQSWMGSDLTNDDLVRESSTLDDYDHTLLGVEPALPVEGGAPRRALVLEYVPHEDAPVVWGRIVSAVDAERYVPLQQDFYDEDGSHIRRLRMGRIERIGERWYPRLWSVVPMEKEGHETRLAWDEVAFDVPIDESVFTKRNLGRPE